MFGFSVGPAIFLRSRIMTRTETTLPSKLMIAMTELNLMRLEAGLGQNKLEDSRSSQTTGKVLSRGHFPDGDDLEDDADGVDQKSHNDGFSLLWPDETPEQAGNKHEIDEEISLVYKG